MNSSLATFLGLTLLVAPLATGCAARTAPFDQMDQAQITVLRLSAPPPPPQPVVGGAPGGLIPGLPIPPELQQLGQQAAQAAQAAGIPVPPGLIPGQQATPMQPQQPPVELWNGLAVLAKAPVQNDDLKNQLLDVFGYEASFQDSAMQCNTVPGMGVAITRPNGAPVDLLVSFSCTKAFAGQNFSWPYVKNGIPKNGLTSESQGNLNKVYQALFGMPVPPGS
jgi:hypothetical protein